MSSFWAYYQLSTEGVVSGNVILGAGRITLARRVLGISAPWVNKVLCICHEDRLVPQTDLTFISKINLKFHRSEDIVPPFAHHEVCARHTLHVLYVFSFYLSQTKEFRNSKGIFVSLTQSRLGSWVSPSIISQWIMECIVVAYKCFGKGDPRLITHWGRQQP